MSIFDQINRKLEAGLLFCVEPPNSRYTVRRKVLLTTDVHRKLTTPELVEEARIDELWADLVTFSCDEYVTPRQIWRLDEGHRHGVWEIRSYESEPQFRLFGHFAARNWFVAFTLRHRSDFSDRTNWTHEINKVRGIWREMFPGYSPLTSSQPNRLFDGALNEKYFRDNQ